MIWRVCPSVSFRASLVRTAVAAIALTQSGHPAATWSNLLERYATGHFQGPRVCVRTPFAIPRTSVTKSWNGFSRLGRANAGAVVRAAFRASNAFLSSPQAKFSPFPPVLVYRGLAISANPGIQSLQ
uniref:Secreted protein n=1 Tax=Rousettus aegyptiacus TaxID=9407 RepID=A0A7J8HSS1_ROUAE|nr:hypothetical protein HJG63_011047 [Rousettus aegyptiacus]